MNSVDRATKSSSQPSSVMWLEICGILLGVTAVFGLALLRAELRDRTAEQQGPQLEGHELSVGVIDQSHIAVDIAFPRQ